MTLGQFATVVGAPPRWVQNARAVLGQQGRYDDAHAKRLGLAREIAETTGMTLARADGIARDALGSWPERNALTLANADGSVAIHIDVDRYLAAFATRLSQSRESYAERTRGPRRARPRSAMAAARAHGIDPSLLDVTLSLTPRERLARLGDAVEFLRQARQGQRSRRVK